MHIRKSCADDTFIHNDKKFKNSKEETILGVIIDNKLTFDSHINRMYKKADQNLSALSRISAFNNLNKMQILFQSMIKSQFSYCPLIWMFCSRKSNDLINEIHKRSLWIVTHDKNSNFEDPLKSNNQITAHQRNLQVFMTEVFQIINSLRPPIIDNFFIFCKNTQNIQNFPIISNEHKTTMRYGQETLQFRTP